MEEDAIKQTRVNKGSRNQRENKKWSKHNRIDDAMGSEIFPTPISREAEQHEGLGRRLLVAAGRTNFLLEMIELQFVG